MKYSNNNEKNKSIYQKELNFQQSKSVTSFKNMKKKTFCLIMKTGEIDAGESLRYTKNREQTSKIKR